MDVFYRSADVLYRDANDNKPGTIEGRMVPYNTWAEVRSAFEGHFLERILPGALTKTLKERAYKMRVLFHHGFDPTLGKQPIAAIEELRDEEDGAYYRARLFASVPELIVDGLRSGQYGASIGMREPIRADVNRRPKKSDYNPEGLQERSVTEASVQEFSITPFPVYEGATASVRSVTDEVLTAQYGDALTPLIISSLVRSNPDLLVQLVRNEQEAAPEHPEPDEEAAPEPDGEEADAAPEEDEPQVPVEAGRATQPKPKKDWLSEQEARPKWKLP